MINKRLFGATFSPQVRKKLLDRQRVASQTAPGESIQAVFPDKDGNVQADLSSRTPFVRMWTSVKLIEPPELQEKMQEISHGEYLAYQEYEKTGETEGINPYYLESIQKKVDKYKETYPEINIVKVADKKSDDSQNTNEDETYYIDPAEKETVVEDIKEFLNTGTFKTYRGDNTDEPPTLPSFERQGGYQFSSPGATTYKYYLNLKKADEQFDYTQKTYIVGDYNYQKSYGEVDPGELIINKDESVTEIDDKTVYELFPSQLQSNPLMKPQSGITSITSETDGTLGVIKKTTVNFIVNNFTDYDRIYNRYFLRPGATVFVDFGWSSIENLYNPEKLIDDKKGIQHFLYAEGNDKEKQEFIGHVTKNEGDLDVIQGIVTDYNSKILQNGSVECSVTLTSSNSALLSFSTDEDVSRKIKSILETGMLYLGVHEVLKGLAPNSDASDLEQLMNTPDYNDEVVDVDNYNKNLKLLARNLLSSPDGAPDKNAVRVGVFVENFDMENTYISLGKFEDFIINSQFGFGKDLEDINKTDYNAKVRVNSSESYTTWNKKFADAQKIMFVIPEERPTFLYPSTWSDGLEAGSYNWQKGKFPKDQVFTTLADLPVDFNENTDNWNTYDIKRNRIPLREIFINTDIIVKAFQQETNVKKVIKQILNDINKSSQNIMDLTIIQGDTESEIKIIDKNYSALDTITDKNKENQLSRFIFDIMSPNSIVKDYNLEFKLPSDSIGNMYAIQAMSSGDSIFSVKKHILELTTGTNNIDSDSLSIVYNPDNGSYRARQLLNASNDTEIFNVYDHMKRILNTNVDSPTLVMGKEDSGDWISADNVDAMYEEYSPFSTDPIEVNPLLGTLPASAKPDKESKPDAQVKHNDEAQRSVGMAVCETFSQYFKYKITGQVSMTIPRLLPYSLSLSMYGISSIQPGDTFRVNYLPKMYLEHTFLQVVKVIHDVGADGWYTKLETVFRLNPITTIMNTPPPEDSEICLSAAAVNSLPLLGHFRYYIPESTQEVGEERDRSLDLIDLDLKKLLKYGTNFQVIDLGEESKFDLKLEFSLRDESVREIFSDEIPSYINPMVTNDDSTTNNEWVPTPINALIWVRNDEEKRNSFKKYGKVMNGPGLQSHLRSGIAPNDRAAVSFPEVPIKKGKYQIWIRNEHAVLVSGDKANDSDFKNWWEEHVGYVDNYNPAWDQYKLPQN